MTDFHTRLDSLEKITGQILTEPRTICELFHNKTSEDNLGIENITEIISNGDQSVGTCSTAWPTPRLNSIYELNAQRLDSCSTHAGSGREDSLSRDNTKTFASSLGEEPLSRDSTLYWII